MSNEELKAVVQEAIQADLFGDCSEVCKNCSCYDNVLEDCICVNFNDVPFWCPQYDILVGQLHLDDF